MILDRPRWSSLSVPLLRYNSKNYITHTVFKQYRNFLDNEKLVRTWMKRLPALGMYTRQDNVMIALNAGLILAGKYATIQSPEYMARVLKHMDIVTYGSNDGSSGPNLTSLKKSALEDATKAVLCKIIALICNESRHVIFNPIINKTESALGWKTFNAIHQLPLLELQSLKMGQISTIQSRGIKAVGNLMSALFFRVISCSNL